jgi:hypothetical protein
MTMCKRVKENLTAYICGELSPRENEWVEEHLHNCAVCSEEYEALRRILGSIDESDRETDEVMGQMDWDSMAGEIAGMVRREAESRKPLSVVNEGERDASRNRVWKTWGPMAAVFLLGLFLGYVLFYSPGMRPVTQGVGPVTDEVSLARLETALDEKEALDYLKQTQLLLTDIMEQPAQATPAALGDSTLDSSRARGLLEKNRYVSQNLDRSRLASARNVLEKTRFLLTEIVMMDELTPEQLQLLRDYVKQERLFLKIRLVEKELTGQNGI